MGTTSGNLFVNNYISNGLIEANFGVASYQGEILAIANIISSFYTVPHTCEALADGEFFILSESTGMVPINIAQSIADISFILTQSQSMSPFAGDCI